MKVCPTCQNQYPDDANFCPREECAGADGPQKLKWLDAPPPPSRFVLVSRIGGGPSGELWQASDSETGGAVAYKQVSDGIFASPLLKERCLRELKQLQRATSPRIARVIEAGRSADGALFVASELVAGEPLDQVVSVSGPMPLERAKRIVAQIGEALLDGQKVGLVHRELNSKNILLLGDDSLKVLNFTLPHAPADHPLGVAEFMSPEQAEGKLVDQRSNTYSLGAILYFLLTGSTPVSGGTVAEVIEAITKGEVAPPSIRRGGGLTAEVDRVVLKALDKNSSRRPLTLRQFLGEVAGLVVTDEEHLLASAAQARHPDPGSPPTVGPAGGKVDVGFARTVMFAGGSSEIQKMVAEAVAARDGAEATSAASVIAAGDAPSARQDGLPPGAAAQVFGGSLSPNGPSAGMRAATEAASLFPPASAGTPPHSDEEVQGARTPPPAVANPGPPPAGAPKRPSGDAAPPAGGNFRETLWFKKGDVDQMVAEARTKMAEKAAEKAAERASVAAAETAAEIARRRPAGGEMEAGERAANPAVASSAHGGPTSDSGPAAIVADGKPLEDRYVDDGTVTVDDRKKFSLRSGPHATPGSPVRTVAAVPGERMSETEVLEEIAGNRRWLIIAGAVVVGLVAAGVVWSLVRAGGRGESPGGAATTPAETPATMAAPPPAAGPTPSSPPEESAHPAHPAHPAAAAEAEPAPMAARPAPGAEPAAAARAEATTGTSAAEPAQAESISPKVAAHKKVAVAKKKQTASSKKPSSSTKSHR